MIYIKMQKKKKSGHLKQDKVMIFFLIWLNVGLTYVDTEMGMSLEL